MPPSAKKSFLPLMAAVAWLAFAPEDVEGHAYLHTPIGRNFYGTDAFQDSSYPEINYCPHCFQSRGPAAVRERGEQFTDPDELDRYGGGAWPHLFSYERGELLPNGNYLEPDSIAVRHGICGDPEQTKAEGSNLYGKENSNYPVLATYEEGQVMEAKVVFSTYHWGHLEFFLCNADDLSDPDGVVTQGCFNMHPLDRAADDGAASPIDPDHSGRYYVDPTCRAAETDQTKLPGAVYGDVVTARYKLPDGVTCERCIVQMVYYTGNSCKHPGYDEFDPPSWPSECAPAKAEWIQTSLGMCGDEGRYPEEFWNCADITKKCDEAILERHPAPSPPRRPAPLLPPITGNGVSEPTPSPVQAPTPLIPPPTPSPTYAEYREETPFPSVAAPTPSPADTEVPETPEYPTPEPETPAPVTSEEPPSPTQTEECDDPAEAYGQCAGDDSYDGPTCCVEGYECVELADCYSECRPVEIIIEEVDCSNTWEQCGGIGWDGPTCCDSSTCVARGDWYSQCVP
ncbi:unnamed protein product [Scytosiphon promiscuus]